MHVDRVDVCGPSALTSLLRRLRAVPGQRRVLCEEEAGASGAGDGRWRREPKPAERRDGADDGGGIPVTRHPGQRPRVV